MGTRIISGVIGIAVAAFVIQTGGILFGVAALLLGLIAYFEYCRAFRQKGLNPALLVGGVLIIMMWYMGVSGNTEAMGAVATLSVLSLMLMTVLRHGYFDVLSACVSAAGVLYMGLAFSHLVLLRYMNADIIITTPLGGFEMGCAYLWIAFIGTWASDSFAYFSGCAFGKHKMCPSISPKKTIEGLVGGMVGTTASVAALGVFFGFNVIEMAVLGFFICVVATLGDLVESVVKRYTGIKDSGNLIPGHGGAWDRFDSVIYTVPFVYYFIKFVSL